MAQLKRRRIIALDVLQETQTIVTLLTSISILHLRTTQSVYFAVGATVAAVAAKILKKFIKQPRPASKSGKTTYGMPSTHSASIGFMAAYLTLACCFLQPHRRLQRMLDFAKIPAEWGHLERTVFSSLAIGFASSVWWSRIRLGHHTTAQVVAGASLGAIVALFFFILWHGTAWLGARSPVFRLLSRVDRFLPREGLQLYGELIERICEDGAFVLLEAWETRDVRIILAAIPRLA